MKTPLKKKWFWLVGLLAVGLIVGLIGFNNKLAIVPYSITTTKLNQPIRVALVTDLHSCYYGEGQRELLDAIANQKPDVVLLGGDIVDDILPQGNALIVIDELGKKYPTYYVSGNHEVWTGRLDLVKRRIRRAGITVLEGQTDQLKIGQQTIQISGLDDPEAEYAIHQTQLEKLDASNTSDYHILLSHRPEFIKDYLAYPFDLILSGHAHGGQWRLPGLINGLIAPGQGLFPKYAGGHYSFDKVDFIVSRGLARESTIVPRIFNQPELVIITLQPKQ